MRRLFRFRYPKILALIIIIVASYIFFSNPQISAKLASIDNLNYWGVLIGGVLIAFGFSAPIGIGLFLTLNPNNIFLASLIGACGALFADLLIFKTIKFSFMDEFERLEKTRIMKEAIKLYHKDINQKIQTYLLYTFAGIVIASPLPDEVGVSMLAGLTKIKQHKLAIISLACHFVGILAILLIS